MAADPTFAGALIDGSGPEFSSTRLFGRRLRKFSLHHRLVLKVVNSPFVTPGARISMWDLRVAVAVCCLQFGDSRIRRPWLIPALLYARMTAKALLWPFGAKPKPGDKNAVQRHLERLTDVLVTYFGDYTQEPQFAVIPPETSGPTKPKTPRGQAPEELDQVCTIMHAFPGISEERAWNMPIGLANWYRAQALALGGVDVDFVDNKEKRFQESLPPEYRHGPARPQ